jgi:UDP-glucose 6-dehydrogenase
MNLGNSLLKRNNFRAKEAIRNIKLNTTKGNNFKMFKLSMKIKTSNVTSETALKVIIMFKNLLIEN